MAELTHKELLQPSLLDRLTDEEPGKRQESRERRVMSSARLKESVRRDLAWLFNTTNLASVQSLDDAAHVAASVVNYGLPDLAGHTASSVEIPDMERRLLKAIWDFEPRLMRSSVRVRLTFDQKAMSHNAMSFLIEADLWAQPLPMRLFLRTEIDLENGNVEISEASGR